MAVRVGPAPWSAGFRRANAATLKKNNVEWSLSKGYRQANEWDNTPRKPSTKKIRLYNGRTVEVPDADYEDFIGHWATPPSDPDSEVAKYIDEAFADLDKIQDVDGVGHIKLIEYNPTKQVLRVEFVSDGAVVVFFRVPTAVYSELYYLATSGAKSISSVDGTERHVLGMKFWDIVRIRGQLHGSRYRFEYVIEGERRGTAFSRMMEEERAVAPEVKVSDSDEQLYDRYASTMLTGAKRNEYAQLRTVKEKENYLHKVGII